MDKTIVSIAVVGTVFFLVSYLLVWILEKKKKEKIV